MSHQEITSQGTMVVERRERDIPFSSLPEPAFGEFPQCPRCDRPADRDHFVSYDGRANGSWFTYLLCDHCDVGYEVWWQWEGYVWRLKGLVRYQGPAKLAEFAAKIQEMSVCA